MATSSCDSLPRIKSEDVTKMEHFSKEDEYPEKVGLHPYGTLEKGFAWLCDEKLLPENTDSSSRQQLFTIDELYEKALNLANLLRGTNPESNSPGFRRIISKSEETEGSTPGPYRRLVDLYMKIDYYIRKFNGHKATKRLERENAGLTIDLLQAIEVADQALLVFSMGDYYAALCKDFKDAKEFTMPSERTKWKFLGYAQFSEIVADYDKEQANPDKPMPLTKSFELAVSYTDKRYKNVEQIVSFMRCYGARNVQVHPVKKFFDEGNAEQVRKAVLRDYHSLPFLGSGPETDKKKEIVKEVLDQVVDRFFSRWTWEEDGNWQPSPIMMELQARDQERTHGIGMTRNAAWELIHSSTPPNPAKGDRTREKSLAEDEAKDAIRMKESDYDNALAQCAGLIAHVPANLSVMTVLESLKTECKEAINAREIEASNATRYKKNWDRSVTDAVKAKEKAAKKLERVKAEMKAEMAELEAENEEKDLKIAELVAENDAKDVRIAELEARIRMM